MMRKETTAGNTRYSKLSNAYVHFVSHGTYSPVHIVDAEMFTHQAQKMFRSAGDDNLCPILINKLNCVANQISPCCLLR